MADREYSWQKANSAGDPAEIARVQADIDARNPTKPGQYTGKPVPLDQKEQRPPEVNDNRIEAIKDKLTSSIASIGVLDDAGQEKAPDENSASIEYARDAKCFVERLKSFIFENHEKANDPEIEKKVRYRLPSIEFLEKKSPSSSLLNTNKNLPDSEFMEKILRLFRHQIRIVQ